MKHQARKRFGQHFLTDQGVIAEIVDAINPQAGQHMLEIGPGLAAMTQPLVERVGHLQVIELDRDLAAHPVSLPGLDEYCSGLARHDSIASIGPSNCGVNNCSA